MLLLLLYYLVEIIISSIVWDGYKYEHCSDRGTGPLRQGYGGPGTGTDIERVSNR